MHLNQDALRFRSGYGIIGWTKIWTCAMVGARFPLDSARGSHPARIRVWIKIDLFRMERHLCFARGSHPARIRGWTKIDLFRWSGISASLNIRRDPAQDYWIGIWLLKFGREYSHTNRQKTIKPQLPDLRK